MVSNFLFVVEFCMLVRGILVKTVQSDLLWNLAIHFFQIYNEKQPGAQVNPSLPSSNPQAPSQLPTMAPIQVNSLSRHYNSVDCKSFTSCILNLDHSKAKKVYL